LAECPVDTPVPCPAVRCHSEHRHDAACRCLLPARIQLRVPL
jgi:hypothetical protein